ncbi:hypothetical protein CQ017_13790 [Arthrobacter sp. MYb224]|uniref:DUF4303 domain-containing protein n=1 Tax=Arthrobacter sp. MYb224 TaxID=1848600 RepID=UPI000CFCFB70|nr:DUF4303 domain-containing protein [Arthrobacter sp. MYb224]PQZ97325.1 hypothetical protein CQ017_13790 [Arthrobacter sp. MYb224]
MGVDWTALEEAIRVAALRHAAEVIAEHPEQNFYAIALHGVSTSESENIAMPLLALNSVEALERDRQSESRDLLVERGEDLDEDDNYEDRSDADLQGQLSVEHVTETEDEFQDSADETDEADEDGDSEDLDAVLSAIEADLEEDDGDSFYSDKWEPSDWHWSAIDLCQDPAAQIWSDAMTDLATREGWESTIKRYYHTLVAVAQSLREELNERTKVDLVAYVADDDHAEKLLELCLTPQQLVEHFPQLEQPVQ